jgi:hypothetical protein
VTAPQPDPCQEQAAQEQWRPPEGWLVKPNGFDQTWVIHPPPGYGDPMTILWTDYPFDCELVAETRRLIEERIREREGGAP